MKGRSQDAETVAITVRTLHRPRSQSVNIDERVPPVVLSTFRPVSRQSDPISWARPSGSVCRTHPPPTQEARANTLPRTGYVTPFQFEPQPSVHLPRSASGTFLPGPVLQPQLRYHHPATPRSHTVQVEELLKHRQKTQSLPRLGARPHSAWLESPSSAWLETQSSQDLGVGVGIKRRSSGRPEQAAVHRSTWRQSLPCQLKKGQDALIMTPADDGLGYTCITVTRQGVHWEQPIFTTKAHVFQIDPNTKKKWLPASTQAINVSYYYDSTRNSYRIISVEGSKAVINSTILPTMQFTKTSQKFGQWTDPRANTVYGLGFASEAELSKFVEKFKDVKELTRQAQTQKTVQTNGDTNHAPAVPEVSSSPVNIPKPISNLQSGDVGSIIERRNSGSTSSLTTNSLPAAESQLKYENDRLKIALAQSSANAKKWEVELQTLKNNNARLTTALQESTSNVEEWKRQLAMYKEESARMKKRVIEMEKGGGGSDGLQRQVSELSDKISLIETSSHNKDQEIADLQRQLDALKPMEAQNKLLSEKIQHLESENKRLHTHVGEIQSQTDQTRLAQQREKQQMRTLHDQLRNKISELYTLQDQVTSLLSS